MPPISFNEVPSSARTPLTFVEIDGSRAQRLPAARPWKAALIGQRRAGAGTVAELVPTACSSADAVAAAFGRGSMLHAMARAWFAQRPTAEATFIALDDPSGGDAATATVAWTASSPAPGTAAIWVGGRRYAVPVTTASTATTLAAALAAAITADADAQVTASSTDGTTTVTARHDGAAAGALDIRHSHASDEALPSGVGVTITGATAITTAAQFTTLSGGAGSVDLSEAIAVLPADDQFQVVINPYTDSTSLTALEAELADRFGAVRQIGGLAFQASASNVAGLTTLGNGRNSPHSVILTAYGSPTTPWEIAAAAAAVVAKSAEIDPARPFQTLTLAGIQPARRADRLTQTERNTLLFDGVATTTVTAGGLVALERVITTYQLNGSGLPDTAYLDANSPLTLDLLRYELRSLIASKYARHKLANDGTRFSTGQAIVTPRTIQSELVALARSWEARGLVEGIEDFAASLIVERNASDPNRLDVFLSPDLVNQLRVTAVQIGFLL